ncbi:MAG: outer membrane protein [Methyloceanibacter sp.]|uniref:outer membrane protein n=1 Tax=Methyloceanibacter sp. TaxID=1965321 RepID=UPI003D6D7769
MAPLPIGKRAATLAFAGALAGLLALTLGASPAAAEFQLGVYGGWSESFDSDVDLVQPGGTNMVLNDVPWDGKSFESPPYWGVRGIYWLNANPNWGLMVDYHHAKIYSELGATVGVSGTRDGAAIGGRDRVGNTFDILEFTDGLNEIFFGGMYRWQHQRWTPYVGLGVGFAFPHVEVRTGAVTRTFEYQVTGVAVEGLVGVEYNISERVSVFGDYKLSYSSNTADLNGGGTLETDVWTNSFLLGLAYRFGQSVPVYDDVSYK